jgi:hypothetical protein
VYGSPTFIGAATDGVAKVTVALPNPSAAPAVASMGSPDDPTDVVPRISDLLCKFKLLVRNTDVVVPVGVSML